MQVLNGTISERGVLAPMNTSLNKPLMQELKEKYGQVSLYDHLRARLL